MDTTFTQVLRCDPSSITFDSGPESAPLISCQSTHEALKLAARHLVDLNDVVAFPTETVYGLGANALEPSAVSRIFSTKGRPSDNPLIVHVSSYAMLERILPKGYQISSTYRMLMDAFWPGALTLLFPAPVGSSIVPREVTAGHPTVAVRMPSHPIARALIAIAGTPLAAPSANASGKPSPTRAEHVVQDLDGRLSIVLDGGPCAIGVESTVVDGLNIDGDLRVLRPGGVTVEDMERVLGSLDRIEGQRLPKILVHRRDYEDKALELAPTTPGMKYRHYSPSVPVILVMTSASSPAGGKIFTSFPQLLDTLKEHDSNVSSSSPMKKIGLLVTSDSVLLDQLHTVQASIHIFALGQVDEPATSAARLYDGLLTLERDGVDLILIEGISEDREGLAFMNRAKKAASDTKFLPLSRS